MKKSHAVLLLEDMNILLDMHGVPPAHFREWISEVCGYLIEVDKKLEEIQDIQYMDELSISTDMSGISRGLQERLKTVTEYSYRLVQNGMTVAQVYSQNRKDAVKEILHYAAMYIEDGDVEIQERRNKSYAKVNAWDILVKEDMEK